MLILSCRNASRWSILYILIFKKSENGGKPDHPSAFTIGMLFRRNETSKKGGMIKGVEGSVKLFLFFVGGRGEGGVQRPFIFAFDIYRTILPIGDILTVFVFVFNILIT